MQQFRGNYIMINKMKKSLSIFGDPGTKIITVVINMLTVKRQVPYKIYSSILS